jgi:hypothetical protein
VGRAPKCFALLSPAFPPVSLVSRTGGIEEGARVELRVGIFRWVALHTAYERDSVFVDEHVRAGVPENPLFGAGSLLPSSGKTPPGRLLLPGDLGARADTVTRARQGVNHRLVIIGAAFYMRQCALR